MGFRLDPGVKRRLDDFQESGIPSSEVPHMYRALHQFAAENMVMAMAIAVFALFMGAMINVKLSSRFGFVIMIAAVAFGLFTLKVNGIFKL
jgi:hypothetical protein